MDATRLAVVRANANAGAFLHVIRVESSQTDDAYRMINGGGYFTSFDAHPYGELPTTQGGKAAGAYQFLPTTYAGLRRRWPQFLKGFTPPEQDDAAILYMYELGALDDVLAGRLANAVERLKNVWVAFQAVSLDRLTGVFLQYGGKLASQDDTQPAAPIEDRSTPYQPEGSTMPAALVALAQILISAFTPLAQQFIADKVNKAAKTGDPTIGQGVASAVLSAAQGALGIPDRATPELTAAAVVAAAQDKPEVLKAAEDAAIDYLQKLAPLFEKIAAQDLKVWEAEDAGRDRAAARANTSPAEDWMAKTLVVGILGISGLLIIFVTAVAGVQIAFLPTRTPTTEVWAALTGIVGTTFGILGTVYAFRFGTTRNNSLKDLTVEQLSRRK